MAIKLASFQVQARRREVYLIGALAAGIFCALLLPGITLHGDYGVSWDEALHRNYGREVTRYALETGGAPRGLRDRLGGGPGAGHSMSPDHARRHALQHGPVFEVLLFGLERLLNYDDLYHVTRLRHLCSFLLFSLGVVFFFLLCRRLFRSLTAGLLGAAALVLSPRIFAHAFFNTADLAFLSLHIVALYTMVRFLERPTAPRTLAHAAACVLAIDVRLAGLILPVVTLGALALDLLLRRRGLAGARRLALPLASYLFFTAAGVVLLWPVLWSDPAGNLLAALSRSTLEQQLGVELYLGQQILRLPWHYLPVWIGITTPPLQLALMLAGLVLLPAVMLRRRTTRRDLQELSVVACAVLPMAAVIVLGTALYNGWRHMFFVYPPLLVLAVGGLWRLWRLGARLRPALRRVALGLLALTAGGAALHTLVFVVRAHPLQHAYFNALVGGPKGARGRFQVGYYALEAMQGMRYLAAHTTHPRLAVIDDERGLADSPVTVNLKVMHPALRPRFVVVDDPGAADYLITAYYKANCHQAPWRPGCEGSQVKAREIWSRRLGGARIVSVYRLLRQPHNGVGSPRGTPIPLPRP